jgi:hypothetical protein
MVLGGYFSLIVYYEYIVYVSVIVYDLFVFQKVF